MPDINPEHIDALIERLNKSPFFAALAISVKEIEKDRSVVELDIDRSKHFNPFGSVHGGVYASLLDVATYWAVYCGIDENAGYTTADLSVHDLAMAQSGKIIAVGKVIKYGKSLCLCEAEARDENGRLLAYATSKMMMLGNRQSIGELAGSDKLPPKFNNM